MYGIVLFCCIKGDVFMSDLFSSSAIPLYEQMKDKIKEDIDNGTLVAGSRLPTENELSEQFHVILKKNQQKVLLLRIKNLHADCRIHPVFQALLRCVFLTIWFPVQK